MSGKVSQSRRAPSHNTTKEADTIEDQPLIIASRYKTKLCRHYEEPVPATDSEDDGGELEEGTPLSKPVSLLASSAICKCPYKKKCMFAHHPDELRTTAMNLADGITSIDAVKALTDKRLARYKKQQDLKQEVLLQRRLEQKEKVEKQPQRTTDVETEKQEPTATTVAAWCQRSESSRIPSAPLPVSAESLCGESDGETSHQSEMSFARSNECSPTIPRSPGCIDRMTSSLSEAPSMTLSVYDDYLISQQLNHSTTSIASSLNNGSFGGASRSGTATPVFTPTLRYLSVQGGHLSTSSLPSPLIPKQHKAPLTPTERARGYHSNSPYTTPSWEFNPECQCDECLTQTATTTTPRSGTTAPTISSSMFVAPLL